MPCIGNRLSAPVGRYAPGTGPYSLLDRRRRIFLPVDHSHDSHGAGMPIASDIRRVIIVVLDGLRPDAIERFDLAHTRRLIGRGASTLRGTTVAPSITTAAMTSLLTGVSPARHGITTDRFSVPSA